MNWGGGWGVVNFGGKCDGEKVTQSSGGGVHVYGGAVRHRSGKGGMVVMGSKTIGGGGCSRHGAHTKLNGKVLEQEGGTIRLSLCSKDCHLPEARDSDSLFFVGWVIPRLRSGYGRKRGWGYI
eukprot:755636-Hanusia_phi.AAC.1